MLEDDYALLKVWQQIQKQLMDAEGISWLKKYINEIHLEQNHLVQIQKGIMGRNVSEGYNIITELSPRTLRFPT